MERAGASSRRRFGLRAAIGAVALVALALGLARPYLAEPWDWFARRAWFQWNRPDLDRHINEVPRFAEAFARDARADHGAARDRMTVALRRRLKPGSPESIAFDGLRADPPAAIAVARMKLDADRGFVSTVVFRRDRGDGPPEVFKLTIVTESGSLKVADITPGTPEDAVVPD